MKRYLTVLLFCVLLVGASGCCGLNAAFVKSVDDSWKVIGPEYTAYVQNDPTLDAGTKKIRENSAKTLSELINAAKADAK